MYLKVTVKVYMVLDIWLLLFVLLVSVSVMAQVHNFKNPSGDLPQSLRHGACDPVAFINSLRAVGARCDAAQQHASQPPWGAVLPQPQQ